METSSRTINHIRLGTSSRSVTIKVKNKSHMTLFKAGYYCKSGKCVFLGKDTLFPGERDHTIFAKKPFTACGSVGVLTYELDDNLSSRLIILFSNPFNYLLYDRFFAMHITRNRASFKKFYNGMYYHGDILEGYIRGHQENIHRPSTLERDGIRVTASMTHESQSLLRVIIEYIQPYSKGTDSGTAMAYGF